MDTVDGDVKDVALQKLREHYGFEEFRSNQWEAINATLSKRDCLLILPTGGGKSLTFQMPSLITNKITIVITPLLSISKDQVDSLINNHDIEAASWSSQTSEQMKLNIARELASDSPDLRLLYTTPESLATPRFIELLQYAYSMNTLCSLAIDEAHVIVEWGSDFRPSYLNLGNVRDLLPGLPIIAVTASATQHVRSSICSSLKLADPLIIMSTFNRPNIRFNVEYKETIGSGSTNDILDHMKQFIIQQRQGHPSTYSNDNDSNDDDDDDDDDIVYGNLYGGIIYCRLRSTCDDVAAHLRNNNIDAASYHAGMDPSRRTKVQQEWKDGNIPIVVSTIAFGMGIDRSDVRWVIHMDPPSTLEGLYQEAGRGGRDGKPAIHTVYASVSDVQRAMKMDRGKKGAAAVGEYLMQCVCRRKVLLEHFGEKRGGCSREKGEELCDVCGDGRGVRKALEEVERKNNGMNVHGDGGGVHDEYDRWESGTYDGGNNNNGDDGGDENNGEREEEKKVRKESIASGTLPRPVKITRYTKSVVIPMKNTTNTTNTTTTVQSTTISKPQRQQKFKPPRMA